MKIIVLAGGLSTERDVSLTSGTMICNALRRLGHKAVLVDLFFGLELPDDIEKLFDVSGELAPRPVSEEAPDIEAVKASRPDSGYGEIGKNVLEACKAADIVFMALHGEIGENGKLQAIFDVMGIRYTGAGYLGSAMAMQKGIAKQIFTCKGVPTPKGKMYSHATQGDIKKDFTLPVIVKPCSGGSSIGITKAQTAAELDAAIEEAFKYEDEVLVESFITGREFTCGVLDGKALPVAEVVPNEGFYDYKHKYQAGMIQEIIPAPISDEKTKQIQSESVRAFNALGLEVYSRMDFIMDAKGDIYCLEANTLPGMTPTSHFPQECKNIGMSYEQLCQRIIDLSLKKYEK